MQTIFFLLIVGLTGCSTHSHKQYIELPPLAATDVVQVHHGKPVFSFDVICEIRIFRKDLFSVPPIESFDEDARIEARKCGATEVYNEIDPSSFRGQKTGQSMITHDVLVHAFGIRRQK